jgi:autotransporter-associated beta strand protein
VNSVVSVNTTNAALSYTNTTSGQWHVTDIPAGVTLTATNVTMGGLTGSSLVTDVAMTDGGTFRVAGNLTVGSGGSTPNATSVLDLSGLSNFVYSASSGTITLGTANYSLANVKLAAASNNITAATVNDNLLAGSSSSTTTFILGSGTNIFNIGAFNMAAGRNTTTLSFPAGSTGGLRIRGTNGTDTAPFCAMTLGNHNNSGGSGSTASGTLSLNGHPVDIRLGTLTLGRDSNSSATGTADTGTGTISFDTGTLFATNILMAITTTADSIGVANGTINVGANATLIVGNGGLSLVNLTAGSGTGALNITNGMVICSNSIVKTTSAGMGNINMNGGTLTMVAGKTVGTPAIPVDNLNLTSATLQLSVVNNATNVCASALNLVDAGNTVNVAALPVLYGYPSQFPIISYASFPGAGSINLGTLPGTYQGYVSNDTASVIWLVVTNGPSTAKADEWGGGVNNLWNTTTLNWTNAGVAVTYAENDAVTFDDLGKTNLVNLVATRAPLGLIVTNNVLNYSFTGIGSITGPVGLNKQGSASLTLAEAGGDNFSGGVVVGGGTVILDDTNCAISGGVSVSSGATLQIGNNDTNGAFPAGSVDDEGTLLFNRTDNLLVASVIAGGGGLTQNGNGTLTLTTTNGYTGKTIVAKGTLALTNSGSLAGSSFLLVSNATLDVSGLNGQTTVLNSLTVTNATFNLAIAGLQPPISVVNSLTADGIISVSNKINVISLPNIASYPVTFTVIQSAGISLAAGNFNFTLSSLPGGYAGSLSESGGTAVVLTLTSGPIGVRPSVVWNGADVPNLNTNWSDRLNWQLPGVPTAADNVIFNNTASVSASALSTPGGGSSALVPENFNNLVDTNFTIASLTYTNLGGTYHNTAITNGGTLNITNLFTVGALDTTNTLQQEYVTISGSRAILNINNTNASVQVWLGSGSAVLSQATLDLSALDNFTVTASRLLVGASIGAAVNRPSGVLYLARTNVITTEFQTTSTDTGTTAANSGIVVGDGSANNGSPSFLWLGQVNTLTLDTLGIGRQKASATLKFNPIYANVAPYPSVTLQGFSANAVNLFEVGNGAGNTGTTTLTADADLTGGFVTALINTLNIGRASSGNSGAGTTTGSLEFDAGTIVANTANIGFQATTNSLKIGTGTISVNTNSTIGANATLSVNGNLNLGVNVNSPSTAGTLTIGGGTVQANNIVAGTNGASSTITLNSGTLIITNFAGTTAAPLATLNLNGGTLQLMNVNGNGSVTNLVANAVSAGGTTTINIGSIINLSGGTATIPIISYLNGSDPGLGGLILGQVPVGYTGGSLYDDTVNHNIDLIVTPPPTLTWVGAVGSTLNSNWDMGTLDWQTNATPTTYSDPDYVVFDDTASNSIVKLTATLSPGGILVTNNLLNYVFNGGGKISGPGGLVKQGSATLTLDNTGANNFSGAITIGSGTLQVGNNDANGVLPSGNLADNGALVFSRTDNFTTANVISGSGTVAQIGGGTNLLSGVNSYGGATLISGGTVVIANAGGLSGANSSLGAIPGGAVTITNGGTLDVGGNTTANQLGFTNLVAGTAKQFYIAGAGAAGNGAIVNNGPATQFDAFQYITLTANATIGGTNRWDMRGAGTVIPLLDLGGFTLTKTGINQDSMVATKVTGGNIIINQGTISFETTSSVTNGGSVTGTITINSAGTLGHYRTWGGAITRPITLNGGAITNLSTSAGNSTNDAAITLTANSTVGDVSGSDLYLNGIISSSGSFGLTKLGTGRVVLTNVDSYTGNTIVSAGTLALAGNGSIASSPNLTVASGAILDASTRSDTTLTLNANQTLNGFGTVTGIVATASGSTLAPGSAASLGILTLANNATLGGTNIMKLNKTSQTNDVLSVGGSLALGGSLNLTNLSGSLTVTDTFKLFSVASGISGAFNAIVPATPGTGLGWNTNTLVTDGTLRIVATVNTTPTNLTAAVNGNQLTLSWPADHTGWRLLVQTNNLTAGISSNTNDWGTVAGSSGTNQVSISIDGTKPSEFYRLVYP